VPEGVSVGSALLMQYVYIIFADFDDWLVVVHDNLLIAAADSEDLLKKTERVLKRCQEFSIQLNMAKSRFGVDSILFFEYRLEKGKHGIESSRINDVRDIPFPKTLKQVQRFLGCTTFMSPFVPNYADTFRHIFRMSHNDLSFDSKSWEGTDYADEWNKAKEHLRKSAHFTIQTEIYSGY